MNQEPVRVIAPPPLINLAFLSAGSAAHFLWQPWPFFPVWWVGHAAGWPLIGAGLLLLLWALRTLTAHRTDFAMVKPSSTLVKAGPYRFSRNPIYLSFVVAYLGTALVVNTIWAVVLLPAALAVMHWGVIRREERYLEGLFSDEYRQYLARVRRWL